MMWDRMLGLFHRHRAEPCDECAEEDTAEKHRKRKELERREREARRTNDALEDLARELQRK